GSHTHPSSSTGAASVVGRAWCVSWRLCPRLLAQLICHFSLFLERVLVGGIVRVTSLKEATSPVGTICEGLVKRTVQVHEFIVEYRFSVAWTEVGMSCLCRRDRGSPREAAGERGRDSRSSVRTVSGQLWGHEHSGRGLGQYGGDAMGTPPYWSPLLVGGRDIDGI
ncbi:uncharacterized protein LOC119580481, partial [Penaeus monodon]|uniref:uncharacterized protein LOC119580481 n=1 Tax=Penaeus monodon TaxID=6687 RepID=UPI0018A76AA1